MMSEWSVNENLEPKPVQPEADPVRNAESTAPVREAVPAQPEAPVAAETGEGAAEPAAVPEAPCVPEESSAPAEEAAAQEETPVPETATAEPDITASAPEISYTEAPAGAVTPGGQNVWENAPAAPTVSARPRNPGRVWGVCIGIALGLLCCACITLLASFAVAGGRGVRRPAAGDPQPSQQQDEVVDAPETTMEVYEVPREEDGYTTQYIVEQVRDSVVGIVIYDGSGLNAAGGGTGIVMSEDGYIITNAHVVVDAVGLTVVMADESRHTARVVGYDEKTDLAVIKINATGLKPAEFGNSDEVMVGEKAVAIGDPGGLSGSVSQGIVSGLNREIAVTLSDNTVATLNVIQTDAAINPGNSGGPLLNAWGQVIGINSCKIVANEYEGIGFSIPVNEAKPIIDNLIQYGYVKDRAVLGITVIALDATNGPANGLPSQGLYIASILEYSDLLNHGIEPGDVILSANGVELVTTDDLTEELKKFRPGDTMTMEILHVYDNEIRTVEVLLLDSRAGE